MWLKGPNTRKVSEIGTSLADRFVSVASEQGERKRGKPGAQEKRQFESFLAQVDREAASMDLGLFRRMRLANSFKSRLLDNGVEPEVVEQLTQIVLTRLSARATAAAPIESTFNKLPSLNDSANVGSLMAQAAESGARGAHAEAADLYRKVLELKPRHLLALNNLGVALYKSGRYTEAEALFRRAVGAQTTYADAQFNLGAVLRATGQVTESELPLRRAVKLNPKHVEAQVSLGLTLVLLGRLREARDCFEKVLKLSPRHAGALCGIGQVASLEGQFEEAEGMFRRALVFDTRMPTAWAALANLRKMTSADVSWLKGAQKIAASGIAPLEEADLRFAIGKYCDDVGNFALAFENYQRANELQKQAAKAYDREARTRAADETISAFKRDAFAGIGNTQGGCESQMPVFVTGMMRSGTSLIEQIISSHPLACGAGELPFWNNVVLKYPSAMRRCSLSESTRGKLAESYLRTLQAYSRGGAQRIVDKSTFNCNYLGLIHQVFPKARIIYVRRDPIDTCLSCYFHQFSAAHNFTMDLADLAHYYREHRRLIAHWRSVLPEGALLEVPYEELVADQEKWTRRIIDFIGLEWDDRCLEFHATKRPVLTASFWQVRQKMYKTSLARWRNYQKFLGPLRELKDLEA